jgi:hypothetical protein
LTTTESLVIDNPIEGPGVEAEAKDIASDQLEDSSQTDIMTSSTQEPSDLAPVLLEPPVEQPEIFEHTGSFIIDSSLNATETEASPTSISAEPFAEPKPFAETTESK